MSVRELRKGQRGVGEVVQAIRAAGWPHATPNYASGAAGNSDIAYGPEDVQLEIKRTERLRLRDAWKQVHNDAHGTGRTPVVATRWNGGPWLAILELDELLALLALRER